MCGIVGWFGRDAERHVKSALALMAHRGRDGSRVVKVPGGAVGHLLHATVGRVRQPLVDGDAWMVANCEIYNWEELCRREGIDAGNDAELAFRMLLKKGIGAVEEFRGPFAIAFHDGETYLVRDRSGVFPLFHSGDGFASERKALPGLRELHPRHMVAGGVLEYRGGFEPARSDLDDLEKALRDAVRLRIHADMTLFLSGVDSALLAHYLKEEGAAFSCVSVGLKGSPDLKRAGKLADMLDVKWEGIEVSSDEVLKMVPEVARLIESADPVKVEVGLVTHFASRPAGKVAFSGLGADELFGGYARMHRSPEKEALWALMGVYERSTYRDNVIGLANGTEIRLPYLDKEVVKKALGLPPEMLNGKKALRELARRHLGDLSEMPKKAAQYGSRFSTVIPKPKTNYLSKFARERRLAALVSGGKDSWYALYTMARLNYEIACAVVMVPRREDSWMFHFPEVRKAGALLKSRGVPVIEMGTAGEKEKELADLEKALRLAVKQHGVEGVVSGAISSEYQRHRIELLADRIGLSCHAPLWGVDQRSYLRRLVRDGFRFEIVSVAADGLGQSWVGKVLDEDGVEALIELSERYRFNPAGEGGEYETRVVETPSF